MGEFESALNLFENKIKSLRTKVPLKTFNKNKLAKLEINKFYFEDKEVDRVMVVLRAAGCEHYKKTGGCSMCSHFNGTILDGSISNENYISQWNSVIDGSCLEKPIENFNLDNYPIVCLYNLGSLLNRNEIAIGAVKYIFLSLNKFKKIRKVIIESRVEYVNREILAAINEYYDGLVEVGVGVESTDKTIRQLCHHKGLEDLEIVKKAVDILHEFGYKALAYVNFKPCFLTEQESINDAIKTGVDCFNLGFDAISIEPTSLQEYSLVSFLNTIGYYRVPWLWSLQNIVKGIYDKTKKQKLDIRLGGYFDEQVLSGSQGEGFVGRNEIFPYQNSANCKNCSPEFIENIKRFNVTYNINDLCNINKCETCYKDWEDACKVKDRRSISQRALDILGNSDN
ncbi:MAG: hypothetical protein LBI55_03340 [Oscillospiraceae bacterium]|jgi:radical SAM enzyme (TIGR01210 family)|nr:hypothetical protein [Oscillospiraceae bacterium]